MSERCCEFVDSRLRRCPPDRASAVPYGQAGENALRFPHLAHRSAAVHKLHSATATSGIEFDSGKGETFERLWWTVKHEWVYLRPVANGLAH